MVLSAIALLQVKIRLICGVLRKCEAQLNSLMLSSDHTLGHGTVFVLGNTVVGLNATHLSPQPMNCTACEIAGPPQFQSKHNLFMVILPFITLHDPLLGLLNCSCHRMLWEIVVFLVIETFVPFFRKALPQCIHVCHYCMMMPS